MLSLKFIQENPEFVIERLKVKQFDAISIVEQVIEFYKRKNKVQYEVETLKSEVNKLSKDIGQLLKSGKTSEANSTKEETFRRKDSIKNLEAEFNSIDRELSQLVLQLPNLPSALVPIGKSAEDNEIVETGGKKPDLPKGSKPHWELATQNNLIDFELGVKITGTGFPVYKGYGSRLQRALINFFLDQARENGYLEVQPPYVVNEASAYGTGQLPDKEGQMYHCDTDVSLSIFSCFL